MSIGSGYLAAIGNPEANQHVQNAEAAYQAALAHIEEHSRGGGLAGHNSNSASTLMIFYVRFINKHIVLSSGQNPGVTNST